MGKVDCQKVISDQFGNKSLVLKALMPRGKKIKLVQRHKAESDLAVAAASIIARDECIRRLKKLSQEFEVELPRGASEAVETAARELVNQFPGRPARPPAARSPQRPVTIRIGELRISQSIGL